MVVDDQSTGRAILEQVVRSVDQRVGVEGFARPVDAVVWATRHIADLVLVDYMMPDMDGIEFVKRLRALPGYEHVPIVMVTVHDDRKVRYSALDAGITDFLAKPIDARECLARCRNLLTLRRQQLALEDRKLAMDGYDSYRTWLGESQEPGLHGKAEGNNWANFIECVRSRKKENLNAPIEEGLISCTLLHLGNVSYRLGRSLNFDPQKLTVIGDDEANQMLHGTFRAPYTVPEEV